jgi:hypothetical protein
MLREHAQRERSFYSQRYLTHLELLYCSRPSDHDLVAKFAGDKWETFLNFNLMVHADRERTIPRTQRRVPAAQRAAEGLRSISQSRFAFES